MTGAILFAVGFFIGLKSEIKDQTLYTLGYKVFSWAGSTKE